MRDAKAGSGRRRGKKKKRANEASASTSSFGQVRLSAASSAILTLWIRKAHESLATREREKASRLRDEVEELLREMPEDQDWYYSSEMRLAGESKKMVALSRMNGRP